MDFGVVLQTNPPAARTVQLAQLADILGGEIVRKQKFHRSESGIRRRVEPIEERHFIEHHAEIGGKAGHRTFPCSC